MSNQPYIYLAEPIDRSPQRQVLAIQVEGRLFEAGVPFYSPRAAWTGFRQGTAEIQRANDEALRNATAMVAVWPEGVESTGVPYEIGLAEAWDKPVLVLRGDQGSGSVVAWVKAQLGQADDPIADALLANGIMDRRTMRRTADRFGVPGAPRAPRAFWTGIGEAPRPGRDGDVGYDLTVSENYNVFANCQTHMACDISVQLPEGYWGLIQGRSSSWKRGLSVKASVIDCGYRGKLWVDVHNISTQTVVVHRGERIGQLIPIVAPPRFTWVKVDKLDETERGEQGYGSTGR